MTSSAPVRAMLGKEPLASDSNSKPAISSFATKGPRFAGKTARKVTRGRRDLRLPERPTHLEITSGRCNLKIGHTISCFKGNCYAFR